MIKTADTIKFNGTSYTKTSLKALAGSVLVILFNQAVDALDLAIDHVKKFKDKATGVDRTWGLLVRWDDAQPKAKNDVAPEPQPKAKTTKTQVAVPRVVKRRGTNLTPFGIELQACRVGSKQAVMLDLLKRKGGATMDEFIEALSGGRKPWVEATVRSGFGWDIRNKGYGVQSHVDADGVEHFVLVVPEGQMVPKHYTGKNPAQASLV